MRVVASLMSPPLDGRRLFMHKMDRIALQSIPTQLTTTKHVCVVSAVKMFVVSAIVTDIILRIRKIKSFFLSTVVSRYQK
jgi:hypothetical protein